MTLIPFAPLAITQRLAWKTIIRTSHSGLEQRIARRRKPSEGWELTLAVDLELDRRDVRLALFTDPVAAWDLPVRVEAVPVQNEITGASVTVDATYIDWIANGQAVYVEGPDSADAYTTSISGSLGPTNALAVALADAPPVGSFPATLTRIMPIVSIYLDDHQAGAREPAPGSTQAGQEDIGAGVWTLKARTVAQLPITGTGASLTTFDGKVVLDRWPVIEGSAEEQFVAGLTRFDQGGAILQEWSWSRANVSRSHLYMADGDEDRQFWKLFLSTLFGRQVAFLLPTWQPDLDIVLQPTIGGTTFKVDQNPGMAPWFSSASHKWLQMEKADGTFENKKVTSVVDNLDGTETVHVSAAFTAAFYGRASLMELCRLAEDEIVIPHQGDRFVVALHAVVVPQ